MAFDLDHFLSLARVGALTVRSDGGDAALTVAEVAPDGTKMRTSVWAVDPVGDEPPRRLTRSAAGESSPAYLPDGSLLFVSARPDPADTPGTDAEPTGALWRLPAGRGEAELILSAPGGIDGVAIASTSGHVALAIDVFPDVDDLDADAERSKARKEAGVDARLFEHLPIRFWDHYVGPREVRYFLLEPSPDAPTGFGEPRQVTVGDPLHPEAGFDITPDGSTLVIERRRSDEPTDMVVDLVAVDVASGAERRLTGSDAVYAGAVIDHTGRFVACTRVDLPDDDARDATLWLVDLTSGDQRDLTPDFDLMPAEVAWFPDDSELAFTADDRGHRPVYLVPADAGAPPRRLTEEGSYSAPAVTDDHVVGLRSGVARPAAPVTISIATASVTELASPGSDVDLPGRLVEVAATADDGVTIRSWLVLPSDADDDDPAPLVVWVHGGPVDSWNDWSWRWNPWLLAERGYAVLLPDPALSTGYGREFLRRGHRSWGDRPYTDVLAAVDAAAERADIDADRTALMGGSFGGYMANWVAGHTYRFRCIVTHASLWALDQFHATTDSPPWWEVEWGDAYANRELYLEHSPHRFIDAIATPMLVIHGELDHRVPIGEALRLWTDLRRHGVESKFLYFPDENHWVLKPQNARIWYETVFAWLDHHVLGAAWRRPDLL